MRSPVCAAVCCTSRIHTRITCPSPESLVAVCRKWVRGTHLARTDLIHRNRAKARDLAGGKMLTWHAQSPGFISSMAEGKGRKRKREWRRDRQVEGKGRSGPSSDTSALSQITAEGAAHSQAWLSQLMRLSQTRLQQPKLGCSRGCLAQGPVASRWAAGSGNWSSRHTDVPATLGSLPASSSP